VLDRLKANSQVTGAAIVFGLPFHDENYASTYSIAGRTILPPADRARAGLRIVTEDYFAVMRMRLIQGRFFAATDRAGAPGVCIVNESLAHRQFGTQRVLGNVVLRGRDADQPYEIVGVVADVKTNGLRSITPDEVFYPFRQIPRANAAIVARTAGDPEALGPVIQAAVAAVSPDQPVSRFASMDRRLRGTLGGERVVAALTTGFAGIALILAAVGVYAVLAHNVSARTVEIGIRMAIGADRINIVRLILSQGMRLVALGMINGVSSAMIASRFLATLLYEVSPYDPWAYGLVAATFVAVGIIASFAPAVRASRVDPLSSLNAT
jgi:putative ABC transport system permease protein